uniref:J domain-containing protein n=1 Tax=Tanacetum cinerariifolium TaxID=118510 RepID=A0A6L2K1W7_TANCI|nr:hypothetical protein [Tanacetum cinerariifolium]
MDLNIQKPDPKTILGVADDHLRRLNYSDCRKYALQLPSHFTGVNEILAVADILLATTTTTTLTDWYDVIQVPRFSTDNELITKQFNKLYDLLNPSVNKFAYADEALRSLCKAWNVLSNRVKKLEFDEKLREVIGERVFWTVCPYCWYVYEYDRVYLGVFMKCCNAKCGRAFTCTEIDKPPEEVLSEGGGRYLCTGFLMVGVREGEWNPFLPKASGMKVSGTEFVELSDDDEVEKKAEVKIEEEDVPVKKTEKRRKKAVAKKTKKVTGAGNRVTREGFMNREEEKTDAFGYGAGRIVNAEYF